MANHSHDLTRASPHAFEMDHPNQTTLVSTKLSLLACEKSLNHCKIVGFQQLWTLVEWGSSSRRYGKPPTHISNLDIFPRISLKCSSFGGPAWQTWWNWWKCTQLTYPLFEQLWLLVMRSFAPPETQFSEGELLILWLKMLQRLWRQNRQQIRLGQVIWAVTMFSPIILLGGLGIDRCFRSFEGILYTLYIGRSKSFEL